MGSFGLKELLVILVIVALLFGTKKLKNIGSDLGGAIKGFKKGIADDETQELSDQSTDDIQQANKSKKDPVQK